MSHSLIEVYKKLVFSLQEGMKIRDEIIEALEKIKRLQEERIELLTPKKEPK